MLLLSGSLGEKLLDFASLLPGDENNDSDESDEEEVDNEPDPHSGADRCFVLAVLALVVVSALALPVHTNSAVLALSSTVFYLSGEKHKIGALVDLACFDFPLPLQSAALAGQVLGEPELFAFIRRGEPAARELAIRIR